MSVLMSVGMDVLHSAYAETCLVLGCLRLRVSGDACGRAAERRPRERRRAWRRWRGEAADDGAAERGVLLAAFAEAEGHGDHADDHGERGHDDGAEAGGAGFDGGARRRRRVAARRSLAKETTRMLLAVATPMHMMAPISAGTESVVWVRKRKSTMPASAAGSAVMMMKGSSQDWKLTTMSR